ncbi:MAG: AbrB/MazE/SpoVT family DNA-binding domain-containing protein [Thermoplasmata archaeon]
MSEVTLTRLSSKGQVVIPKSLRDIMGLEDGDVFAMYGEDDTIVLKRVDIPSEEEFVRLLEWGESFAKKKKITKKEVMKAIEEYRKGE